MKYVSKSEYGICKHKMCIKLKSERDTEHF